MRLDTLDWSTINTERLRRLPHAELTHGDRLQDDCGNGCAGDPPGFPSYFTRCVYSLSGNGPNGKWSYTISQDGILYGVELKEWQGSWDEHSQRRQALFLELWNRPALDHPRTVAWIQATYSYHRHCYHTTGWDGKDWHGKTHFLIWPGGCCGETPFGRIEKLEFEVDYSKKHKAFDKWRVEEQESFKLKILENNERIIRMCEAEATPDHHNATHIVRRYYPEFNPTPELIEAKFNHPGNWWETAASRPSPDQCPGQYKHAHPVNGSWCQWCGWQDSEKEVVK